jgi:hypothetical protein
VGSSICSQKKHRKISPKLTFNPRFSDIETAEIQSQSVIARFQPHPATPKIPAIPAIAHRDYASAVFEARQPETSHSIRTPIPHKMTETPMATPATPNYAQLYPMDG